MISCVFPPLRNQQEQNDTCHGSQRWREAVGNSGICGSLWNSGRNECSWTDRCSNVAEIAILDHVHMLADLHTCACTHAHAHAHSHMQAHTHACKHTHIHLHSSICTPSYELRMCIILVVYNLLLSIHFPQSFVPCCVCSSRSKSGGECDFVFRISLDHSSPLHHGIRRQPHAGKVSVWQYAHVCVCTLHISYL